MRLNTIYKNHEKEIREIKIGLKNLQTEMNKLNDGIARNQHSETKLKNENFHIQSEFVQKLKELEGTNVKLEVGIDNLKEEKAELLQNIVEAERQLLLWERKIQLEKEIQEALDPEIGQSEIKLLKKDLHRMELRLDELRKNQEKTIQEMERAVYKRDTIQLKYTKNDDIFADKKLGKENKPHIQKQIQNLRGTLAQTTKNAKEYDKKLAQINAEINQRNNHIVQAESATSNQERNLSDTLNELNQRRIEKLLGVFEIVSVQSQSKAFESIAAGRFRAEVPEASLRQRFENQKEMNGGLLDVLRTVYEENPQYAQIIEGLISF